MPIKEVSLALATVLALGFAAWQAWSLYDGSQANGHLPRDFPHAYLPGGVFGDPEAMRVWRGRVPPPPPIQIDGDLCWPAGRCINPECPYRAETGRDWVFPQGFDRSAPKDQAPVSWCIPCAKGKKDHQQITFATVPEGEAILQRVRRRMEP